MQPPLTAEHKASTAIQLTQTMDKTTSQKKRLMPSILTKIAIVKEVPMQEWAQTMGPEEAIAKWQHFVAQLPRGVEFENLPENTKEIITSWENKFTSQFISPNQSTTGHH